MRKSSGFFLHIGILFVLLQTSCTSDKELTIGSQFITSAASMVCIDTLSVDLSSIRLDSIQTSGKNTALIGCYANKDKNIGEIQSRSYIIMGGDNYTLDDEAVLDSFVLVMNPNGYYYGDTLTDFKMQVHEVTEDIELDRDHDYMYNNSSFDFESETIGEKTFRPYPGLKKEIRIPMKSEFSNRLFEKFKSSTRPFDEIGGFTKYFKGILLQSASSANSIIGFNVNNDTSICFKIYYHLNDGSDDQEIITISPSSTTLQFNQIIHNSQGTIPITEDAVSSKKLDNNAYIQGGTGIVTRVDFSSLKNILTDSREHEIIRADLIVQPSLDMDSEYLPEKLYLYGTNKHNDFLSYLTDNSGNQLESTLVQDDIYPENTYYAWTITSYVKQLLDVAETEYNGILILPVDYDSKFDHVIIADQKKSNYRTQLKLYVLYYE